MVLTKYPNWNPYSGSEVSVQLEFSTIEVLSARVKVTRWLVGVLNADALTIEMRKVPIIDSTVPKADLEEVWLELDAEDMALGWHGGANLPEPAEYQ